ncbi:hypothetical protein CDN99_06110 [Roseateles aquatilis]|uniref:Uncharacterized protein n=2 Tax=Roseateles aquatilis TaxID=431061 RepID=A0A246JH04_9BURK|nr:hypothetical protein CDN99_06110 [Roseateles aquatilis]
MDESPPDASVDARRHDLPDPLPAAVASIADALLGLLGWPEDVAIQVSVPCQAPLHYARVRTPRHLIEIIFNPTTGRFDCTSCQAVPLELPPGSASDGGFLRAVLQGLAGATATALLQASPFLIEPWENWALAQEAVEAAPDPEERMGIPGATRVRRKERA